MTTAILLAAGSSLRLKNNVTPKQFLRVRLKKLYRYSLETFVNHRGIHSVVIVVQPEYVHKVQDEVKRLSKRKKITVIAGGKTRQASSYLALAYLANHQTPDYVMIHDVSRPLVTPTLIDKVLTTVKKKLAVTLGREINDSLFVKDDDERLESYLAKGKVYLVQTPQAFAFSLIYNAHEYAKTLNIKTAMDDASLLTHQSKEVFVIPGSRYNFKIVTHDDLAVFRMLIS